MKKRKQLTRNFWRLILIWLIFEVLVFDYHPGAREFFSQSSSRTNIMVRAKAIARSILSPFSEDEWFKECKNSHGSSIGVPYVNTSVEQKFTYPISCTKRVKPLFDHYLTYDSCLKSAISVWNSSNPVQDWCNIVEGSRATTVPKSDTIRRMIAIEPTGNMFFQQGLMLMMYKRMAQYGLSVDVLPEAHKQLAWHSSLDGRKATIDFSSASDCVSMDLLEWLLPDRWFHVVDLTRCESMDVEGHLTKLNMSSTMGNAVTFPLETIVFYCLAQATRLEHMTNSNSCFPEVEDRLECSVFGDDCVVPSEIANHFISICESVGFIVNKEKSFYDPEPGFRESCGGDYYRGWDVRPLHFKAPASARRNSLEPWLYTVYNKIIQKYITYFGSLSYLYEKKVFENLLAVCRKWKIKLKLVPTYYPDDSGLKIAFDFARFRSLYKFEFEPISIDKHGTMRFSYYRYVYRKVIRVGKENLPYGQKRSHDLAFANWIKSPVSEVDKFKTCFKGDTLDRIVVIERKLSQPSVELFAKRRFGSYVVAVSKSAHWSF